MHKLNGIQVGLKYLYPPQRFSVASGCEATHNVLMMLPNWHNFLHVMMVRCYRSFHGFGPEFNKY